MQMQKLDDFDLAGYIEKSPSLDAELIDRSVCDKAECMNCGHKGMTYIPFRNNHSYRAFAECPHCHYAFEF